MRWSSFKIVQGANFINLATHPKPSEKDIIGKVSLHRKQWCMFHLRVSFLHQVTLKFRHNIFTLSLKFLICLLQRLVLEKFYHRNQWRGFYIHFSFLHQVTLQQKSFTIVEVHGGNLVSEITSTH